MSTQSDQTVLSALTSAAVANEVRRTSLELLEMAGTPDGQREAAAERLDRQLYKDPPLRSWRVWATVSGVLTGILAIPEVQIALTAAVAGAVPVAWAPVATAVLTALLAGMSKARDPRPVRP
jgi:hypothetical protein